MTEMAENVKNVKNFFFEKKVFKNIKNQKSKISRNVYYVFF